MRKARSSWEVVGWWCIIFATAPLLLVFLLSSAIWGAMQSVVVRIGDPETCSAKIYFLAASIGMSPWFTWLYLSGVF